MANISGQMDEIFDDGLDFDVIFDQEDSLIDTVAGIKENGMSVLGEDDCYVDENGNIVDLLESDVSIPGEPTTDDGKLEDRAGKANLLDRTTDTKNDVKDQHLNRDAESDGTAAAPQSAMAQVDDTESPSEFRKDLGYTKEEADVSAPGEPDTDDGKNDESANNAAAKTTMANGQNEQKPDDNTSVKEDVDAELFDESFLQPTLDDELLDESFLEAPDVTSNSLDSELMDEAFLNEADKDVSANGSKVTKNMLDGRQGTMGSGAKQAPIVKAGIKKAYNKKLEDLKEAVNALAEEVENMEDPEEDLIDAVEDNEGSAAGLDYEVGEDDVLIDDLLN